MVMRIRYTLFSLVLLIHISPIAVLSQEFRFKRITINEGLLDNNVYEIFQDHDGLIWIGTARGLQCYNGHELRNYEHDANNSKSLASGFVRSITEDTNGYLWIGTQNGGLSRYDGEEFINFKYDPNEPEGLAHNFVETLLANEDGSVWVGTWGGGLNKYADGKFEKYQPHPNDSIGPYNNEVISLAKGKDETLWIGCWKGGLHKLNNGVIEPVDLLNNDPRFTTKTARCLLVDKKGRLWIGSWGVGVFVLDGNRLSFFDTDNTSSLKSNNILSLSEDAQGAVWVGTFGGGMTRFQDGQATTIENVYGDQQSLNSNTVECSLVDDNGDIWIGSFNGGISKLISTGFKSLKHNSDNENSLTNNKVSAITGDNDGNIWFGTMSGGLDRWSEGKFEHLLSGEDKVNRDLRDIRYIMAQGSLIVGGQSSWPYKYDDRGWQRINGYKEQPIGVVYQVESDRQGNIWMCTSEMGLIKVDLEGNVKFFKSSSEFGISLKSNDVHSMAFDKSDRIWLGTHDHGVSVMENDKVIKSLTADPKNPFGLDNSHVRTIFCDSNNDIWIATWGGGLNKYDPDNDGFTKYRNKVNNSDIQSILEDDAGNLWLGTAQGLSRFDRERGEFTNFDIDDGVDTYPFMPQASYLDTPSGNMFFGGENGVTVFDPLQLRLDTRIPKVMLSNIKVLNEEVDSLSKWPDGFDTRNLNLRYSQNSFSVEFAALNTHCTYSYYLEGLEDGWNNVNERRYANYVNVPPGDYKFMVRATNASSVSSEPTNLLAVTIHPPFWQTWWFRTMIIVGLLLLLYSFYEYRLRGIKRINAFQQSELEERIKIQGELQAKNAELERFTYTVSHDLKSPIITIKGYLGLLEEDALSGSQENLAKDIDTIKKATDQMHELLEDLLEYSRIGVLNKELSDVGLEDLVEGVKKLYDKELNDHSIEVSIPHELPTLKLDKVRMREVFQNLIHNAIKFSKDAENPKIEIGIENDNHEAVTLYVKDNGIGIPKQYHQKVFEIFERLTHEVEGTGIGLAIVKRVIEMHGGKIWLSPNEKTGSKFIFLLPR